MRTIVLSIAVASAALILPGCHCGPWDWNCQGLCDDGCPEDHHGLKKRPSITARPASPANMTEPCGFPFYLPKPLLVISKNVYHVESPTVGLTESAPIPTSFDGQDDYASANLNSDVAYSSSTSPPPDGDSESTEGAKASAPELHTEGAPIAPNAVDLRSDGVAPHMFFTYEIVFVPDLTQKYVLDVEGGAGEVRAAINLVNGWQFTGLGPYYMKDSSTAQNLFARGIAINLGLRGAADVVNSIANLQSKAASQGPVSKGQIAAIGKAMSQAAKEEVIDWGMMAQDHWVDEIVLDEKGKPVLDNAGNVVKTGRKVPPSIERYAEVHVYEAALVEGEMQWRPIADHTFAREFLGVVSETKQQGAASSAADAIKALNLSRASTWGDPLLQTLPSAPADSKVVEQALGQTLSTPLEPCPEPWLKRIFHPHRGKTVSRVVNAPLPSAP